MTGTILCVNKSQFVPVIFEPPCINKFFDVYHVGSPFIFIQLCSWILHTLAD
jgi:hypothetical protein